MDEPGKPNDQSTLRQRRESGLYGSGCLPVALLVFGPAPIVVLAYHLWSWQAAVLLLPIAQLLAGRTFPRSNSKRNQTTDTVRKTVFYGFWGIPALAIYLLDIDVMRIWALPVAVLIGCLSFDMGTLPGRASSDSRVGNILSAVALGLSFIVLSEAVFRYLGVGPWIWFHAFWLIISMSIMLAFKILLSPADESEQPQITKSKLPRKPNGDQSERFDVWLRRADKSWLYYEKATLGQAIKIFEGFDWANEVSELEAARSEGPDDHGAFLRADLVVPFEIVFTPLDGEKTHVSVRYQRDKLRWQLMGDYMQRRASDVPISMVPELMTLAWQARWQKLESRLASYAVSD